MKILIAFLLCFAFYASLAQVDTVILSCSDKRIQKLIESDKYSKIKKISSIAARLIFSGEYKKDTIGIDITKKPYGTVAPLPLGYKKTDLKEVRYKVRFDEYNNSPPLILGQSKYITYHPDSIGKFLDIRKIQTEERTYWINHHGGNSVEKGIQEIHYYETPGRKIINCRILSIPDGIQAEVYCISQANWEDEYKFPKPPLANNVIVGIKNKLFNNRIGNTYKPFIYPAFDEPYYLIFDHNGVLSMYSFDPSNSVNKEFPFPIKLK